MSKEEELVRCVMFLGLLTGNTDRNIRMSEYLKELGIDTKNLDKYNEKNR